MIYNYEETKKVIIEIFSKRFGINLENHWEEIQDHYLLGSKIGMNPSDLVYLYFDIEKMFNINISQECIVSGMFNKLSDIVKIISNSEKRANELTRT